MISPELAEFLESGVSTLVGTRDASLRPDGMRAIGFRVERDGSQATVFLPAGTLGSNLANLRDNGRIAVCFSRPIDHRSMQLKGRVLAITEANEADRAQVDRFRAAYAQHLAFVGIPVRVTERMAHWPCWAVRFEVESIFVQTPGPGAGQPLARAASDGAR
ncbi:MAG: pyridoxamine 5'-phosphate oxidase family protein [Planctomycetes bacterium]|nr:pyridoxamine 5'-phosphate oxidase family protein [Planctomycetota bacterium]